MAGAGRGAVTPTGGIALTAGELGGGAAGVWGAVHAKAVPSADTSAMVITFRLSVVRKALPSGMAGLRPGAPYQGAGRALKLDVGGLRAETRDLPPFGRVKRGNTVDDVLRVGELFFEDR